MIRCCCPKRRAREINGVPANLEQNNTSHSFLGWTQDPLTSSSFTADGKPANRFELTPRSQPGKISVDLEANKGSANGSRKESGEEVGPLPEIGPSARQPLPLASEESFGSAISGWSPDPTRFEEAKTVDDNPTFTMSAAVAQDREARKRAGSLDDHEFVDDDFLDAEDLPGSPRSPASEELVPERMKLGGVDSLPPR